MVFALGAIQAPGLASWSPAQWCDFAARHHRASARWVVNCTAEHFIEAVVEHAAPEDLDRLMVIYHPSTKPKSHWGPFTRLKSSGTSATLLRFTPIVQFLDKVDVAAKASSEPSAHPRCEVNVLSVSTACVPSWIPGAVIVSALLCWLPVPDGGCNSSHIRLLRRRLEENACLEIQQHRRTAGSLELADLCPQVAGALLLGLWAD
ncbi:hypothetical protein CYMTET_52922 [Cymbomonas tetramitiformis]|uniref:Uncharacterized protein n=1 Tax=Cymbomonas tetramitiformis TaxID=36881 RepID=A0AAE0BJT4_9CHLO|nr:hypothetical protein CYMTET_52922 [Cymbomonas tetramitiformis]